MAVRHFCLGLGIGLCVLLLGMCGGEAGAGVHCHREDVWCKALVQKTKNLKARDPAAEARAAMDTGDFRLGLNFYFGDPIFIASSKLPGVRCYVWPRSMIGKEHSHQDYIPAGGAEHTEAAVAFLTVYNQTIVADPRFPYPDICAVEGQKRQPAYSGAVTTVAQAVRSGDMAKLKALNPTTEAVNTEDPLEMRPLDWAMARRDLEMTEALIDLGADVPLANTDGMTPVGLAILKGRYDLAKAWRAKGGAVPKATGLCPEPEEPRMPMFIDANPATDTPAPDPDKIEPVGQCGWAGWLIELRQLDMLDYLLATPPATDPNEPERIYGYGDIDRAFRLAVLRGDAPLSHRLFRYVGESDGDYPGNFIGWLYSHKQYDLMRERVLAQHLGAARSTTEAELWRAALEAGQYSAFALLFDYGQEVNRLSKAQLTACRAAVMTGTDGAVFDACIKAGFERSDALITAIKGGDTAAFKALLDDTASLPEDRKVSLDSLVAAYGTADMFTTLIQAGFKQISTHFSSMGREVGFSLANSHLYSGTDKDSFARYAEPHLTYTDNSLSGNDVVRIAYDRGNEPMLATVLASGYSGLSAAIASAYGVGNGLEKYIPGFNSTFNDQVDSETYPNRPADPAVMARLQHDIPLLARTEGPQALQPLLGFAVRLGWNDVVQLILESGFDARKILGPAEFWRQALGWDSVCKPSTTHLLIQAGLPVRYTTDGWGTARILDQVVSTCRDGATVGVIIREGGFDVNEALEESGRTALDEATRRQYPETVKTLVALGGKLGKDAHPDMRQKKTAALAKAGFDPDLWQGPPE